MFEHTTISETLWWATCTLRGNQRQHEMPSVCLCCQSLLSFDFFKLTTAVAFIFLACLHFSLLKFMLCGDISIHKCPLWSHGGCSGRLALALNLQLLQYVVETRLAAISGIGIFCIFSCDCLAAVKNAWHKLVYLTPFIHVTTTDSWICLWSALTDVSSCMESFVLFYPLHLLL